MPKKSRNPEGRRLSQEDARQRRLSAAPPEIWEILHCARRRTGYSKMFEYHHNACAFLARFYRFRMDAIEAHVEGALELRNLTASGVDANNDLFSTNNKMGQAPYLITWTYSGSQAFANHLKDAEVSVPSAQAGSATPELTQQEPIEQPKPKQPDAAEELIRKKYFPEQAGKVDETLPTPGPHICTEWNEYDICVEPTCMKPKDEPATKT